MKLLFAFLSIWASVEASRLGPVRLPHRSLEPFSAEYSELVERATCAPVYTSTITINGPGSNTLPRVTTWVTRSNDLLRLGSKTYRAVGPNIYWLGLDENLPRGTVAYPSRQRIREAIAIAAAMGANTIRSTTLGVSTGHALSIEPSLGVFNQRK